MAVLKTSAGTLRGIEKETCDAFLGVPYARAERFGYAEPLGAWEGERDCTSFGASCPQYRQYFPQLENPERLFYQKEFREGLRFVYEEDCLNLNLYVPKQAKDCPVIVYFHGGGFNSGSNMEAPFRGDALAARGILTVFVNYRVGILGYLTHEEVKATYGREGNFGLDDQLTAVHWVREHISDFGGDPDNITLMGQSAGAISIQYLCLNHELEGLFQKAVMMSGGGLFPRFALPRAAEETRSYWKDLMALAGCESLEQLKKLGIRELLSTEYALKQQRKDAVYHTMPVVDGALIKAPVDQLIRDPLKIPYMIGFTNNDMYAPVMARIGTVFGKANGAYLYYFDLDAPGDHNAAFHSSELRYMFGTLEGSWRPYGARDREVSAQMMDYAASFARTGDPNGEGLPAWRPAGKTSSAALCLGPKKTAMGHPDYVKMTKNMLTKGDPKDGR